MRMCRPWRPASSNDAGLPAVVYHMGSSSCTGRGSVITDSGPLGPSNVTWSPRHRLRTVSTSSMSRSFERPWFSGRSTKSRGCHPEATAIPTRPPDILSRTAHSSAIAHRVVEREHAAAGPDADVLGDRGDRRPGHGRVREGPPKAWKCRSGVHTAANPCVSPKRAASISSE